MIEVDKKEHYYWGDIDKATDSTSRPTITPPTVPTKISSTNKPNNFFARSGLFKTKK